MRLLSHCPWVDNCIGVNNHKHFLLYVAFMIAGIALIVQLTIVCKFEFSPVTYQPITNAAVDISALPNPAELHCALLKDDLCQVFSRDPLTIITNSWAALQLTWTFMLVFVHLTQVARAVTTLETMKGQSQPGPLMTAMTTGSLSTEGAQLGVSGSGPDPVGGHAHGHAHKKKEGCLTQWSRLLGLDTFYTIAFQAYKGRKDKHAAARAKKANPFSRGIFRNCHDFWTDGPIFGRKSSGRGLLGGETVDYTAMYDVPRGGMRYRGYESVPAAEEGEA